MLSCKHAGSVRAKKSIIGLLHCRAQATLHYHAQVTREGYRLSCECVHDEHVSKAPPDHEACIQGLQRVQKLPHVTGDLSETARRLRVELYLSQVGATCQCATDKPDQHSVVPCPVCLVASVEIFTCQGAPGAEPQEYDILRKLTGYKLAGTNWLHILPNARDILYLTVTGKRPNDDRPNTHQRTHTHKHCRTLHAHTHASIAGQECVE
jgi:hypothetical protein